MTYSVIIPVYNVEKELSRCIDSVLVQTITDFELILVNDGSHDRSGIICDEYAVREARIKVIHQENGGVYRARNAGLDIAQGRYIVFVDSDDYVECNYLETFDVDDSDLVVSGTSVYESDGSLKEKTSEEEKTIRIVSEDDEIAFLKKWYALQVTGKRFKRSLIAKGHLRFEPSFGYGEDSVFMAQYLRLINTLRIRSNVTYNYCLTNTDSLTKKADKQWFVYYSMLQEHLFELFSDRWKVRAFLANKFCWVAENELTKICNSNRTRKEKNHAIRTVLNSSHLSTSIKCVGKDLSPVTKVLFRIKLPLLIRFIYTRH